MTKTIHNNVNDKTANVKERRNIMDPKLEEVLAHYTLDQIKEYRERQEEISFPDAYGPTWKDHFSTTEEITKLLQDIKVTDEEIIKVDPAPATSEDRLTVLVTLKTPSTGKITKGIIDFITGGPTWEQFIDVTYDSGINTHLKVIVYDNDSDRRPPKPAGHSLHVSNLVEKNNHSGVKSYLVEGKFSIKKDGRAFQYVIHSGPYLYIEDLIIPDFKDEQPETLPTKRQVQEAEFWVAYNYPYWICRGFERLGSHFDVTKSLGPNTGVDDDFVAKAFWTEEGLIITLSSRQGPDILYNFWNDKKESLKENYRHCPIDLQPNTPDGPAIVVNPIKIPMSELTNMDPEDKADYGKQAYDHQSDLEYTVEDILAGEKD